LLCTVNSPAKRGLTNKINMTDLQLGLIIIGVVIVIVAIGAFRVDRERRSRNPGTRPFRWGYVQGVTMLISGLLGTLGNWGILTGAYKASPSAATGAAICFWTAISGALLLRRRRWSWVLGTILSLQPWLWLINSIYLARRWDEFAKERKVPPPVIHGDTQIQIKHSLGLPALAKWICRLCLIPFVFAAFASLAFLLMGEGEAAAFAFFVMVFTGSVALGLGPAIRWLKRWEP
jgi:hypothetical protein